MLKRFGSKLLIQITDRYTSQRGWDHKPDEKQEPFEMFAEAIPFWSSISHSRSTGYSDSWIGPSRQRQSTNYRLPSAKCVSSPGGFNQLIRLPTDNNFLQVRLPKILLRLLLPLNATVWSSSCQPGRVIHQANSLRTSLKRSIGVYKGQGRYRLVSEL